MIFSCGETYKAYEVRVSKWHKWFAWHPTTIGIENGRGICVWLQYLERRATQFCYGREGEHFAKWEYRILKNAPHVQP